MASVLEKYNREWMFHNEDSASNPEYYLFVDKEGDWYIMRLDTTTNANSATYATSFDYTNTTPANAWAGRTGLTYKAININTW